MKHRSSLPPKFWATLRGELKHHRWILDTGGTGGDYYSACGDNFVFGNSIDEILEDPTDPWEALFVRFQRVTFCARCLGEENVQLSGIHEQTGEEPIPGGLSVGRENVWDRVHPYLLPHGMREPSAATPARLYPPEEYLETIDLDRQILSSIRAHWREEDEPVPTRGVAAGPWGNPLIAHLNRVFAKCVETADRKNADYTGGRKAEDPLYNFRKSEALGVPVHLGIAVRLSDKIARLEGLLEGHEAEVLDEGVLDTIEDAINYLGILHYAITEGGSR